MDLGLSCAYARGVFKLCFQRSVIGLQMSNQDIYPVPDTVVFRGIAADAGKPVRTLLIQNRTSKTISALLSQPSTAAFRLVLPQGSDALEEDAPPHICLTLKANSAFKVRSELNLRNGAPHSALPPALAAKRMLWC